MGCFGQRGRAGLCKDCPLPVLPSGPINREGHVPLINCLSVQAASSRGRRSLCLSAGSSSTCQERGPLFSGKGKRGRDENGVPCLAKQRSVLIGDFSPSEEQSLSRHCCR